MTHIYTWGTGYNGCAGHDQVDKKKLVLTPALAKFKDSKLRFKQVACGEDYCAALTIDGDVWTWGRGYKLGHGVDKDEPYPKRISFFDEFKDEVVFIDCGEYHMGAVTESGRVYLWGKSEWGSIKPGRRAEKVLKPVEIKLPGKAIWVSCAWRVSGVILGSGEAYVWGNGENGLLGTGDLKARAEPTNLGIKNVASLRLGSFHAAAITMKGELYTWGRNNWGNLGHGDQKDRLVPTLVKGIPPIAQVSVVRGLIQATIGPGECGPHTIAVTHEGSAYFFGAGHKGKGANLAKKWGFHLKGIEDEVSPYLVGSDARDEKENTGYLKGETIVQGISAGLHSALVTKNGLVYTFGCGSDGRMGLDGYLKGCGAGRQQMKFYVSSPTAVEELVRKKAHVLMCDSARRHMIALTEKRRIIV